MFEVLPRPSCFAACMGEHFTVFDLNNMIEFIIVPGSSEVIRAPVVQFQMGLPVRSYPSINARNLSVGI